MQWKNMMADKVLRREFLSNSGKAVLGVGLVSPFWPTAIRHEPPRPTTKYRLR